ncbi:MAG: two-component regulator propeller domain-containing protein, partial [Bacteroidota bacterium]
MLLALTVGWWMVLWAPATQAQALTPTDRDAEAGRPFTRTFRPAEYGAHEQTWAVVEDEQGVLYFGNGSGLLTYDGLSWELLLMSNKRDVRSLARDASGRIWVGAVRDLGYLAADSVGQMTFVSLRDKIPEAHRDFTDIWETHASPDGVYFTSDTALF